MLLMACMMVPWVTQAQQEIVIGSGSSTSSYVPGFNYYNYSLSQQIYTADEIGIPGSITSVAFKNTGETKTRNYNVYMVLTSKATFTSASDWVPMSAVDQVFSGSLTFTSGQWTTIQLATPFIYDGVSNLLITVADVTGSYSSSPHMTCLVFNASNQALYKYRDDGIFDVANPNVTGTLLASKNQITLGIIPGQLSCWPVRNLAIVDSLTTTTSLTINWEDTNNTSATYNIYAVTATDTTPIATGITGNSYTIDNLDPMTPYTFGVESDCGSGDLANISFITGRTACATFVVDEDTPFTESFDGTEFPPSCWSVEHTEGTSTYTWIRNTSSSYIHSGTASAQLQDQNAGNKNNLVTPPISIDADNNYRVSFWMYRGSNYPTYELEGVKVWVNTTPDTIGGTPLIYIRRTITQGEITETEAGWYNYSAVIPQSMAVSDFYVVFEGISQYGNATYIDDVTIDRAPDCLPVTNLAIINDSTTAHTATFVWSSDGSSFRVEYKKATDEDWTTDIVSDTTVTLTGLTATTAYNFRVKVLCDDDSSDYSRVIDFTTTVACPAPENLRAILTPGDGTVATLAWNDPTGSAWQICLNGDTNTLIDVVEPSYDLTDLTPETAYTAMVRRDCTDDGEGYSAWTSVITFVPTNSYMLTVNDGTATNSYVPIYGTWVDDHIHSQFIIPASTLEPITFGTIDSLVFYATQSSVSWGSASFNVYLTETGATTVSNLLNVADMTQVYSGSLSIENNKMVVAFGSTSNYQYMGGNLLIAFEEPTSGSYVASTWYGVDATSASLGGYGSSIYQQDFLPKTTIYFTPGDTPDCLPVSNLIVVDSLTTSDSLTISWTDEANSGATYTIYDLSGGDTTEVATISGDSYTFDELAPNTMYTFGVVANCGSDEAIMRVVAGTTACGLVEAPHTWDFEGLGTNATPDCWTTVGSGYTYVVSANSHSGTNAIQFSGSTNNILVLPELAVEANTLQMTLWLRAQSNTSSSGTFDVGYMTDITNPATFVVLDSYNYTEFFTTGSSVYGQRTVMFAGVPDSVRMALRAAPTATYYYWYVDDVTIEELPDCPPVSRLTAVDTAITAESITLSWLSDATDFIVLDMADSSVLGTTNDTSYLIENLMPTTAYTFGVVVDCGGDYSDTVTVTVNTACAAIPIPYLETFEQNNPTIACWTVSNIHASTGLSTSGGINDGGCFRFYYTTTPPQYLISPELSGTDDDSIMIEFRYKAGSATWAESFAVGYSTTNNATESFTWLPEVTNIVDLDYVVYSQFLPQGVKYVSIKCTSYDKLYLYIDSLYLGLPPTCLPVTGLTVTNVDESSATISWNSSADSYSVYNGATYVGTTTDTSYTINGLLATTAYTFGVRAICAADDSAIIATVSVTTPCGAVSTFPFEEEFNEIPSCWTLIDADGDGQNWFIFNTSGTIQSASYNSAALTPDNWLVTPPLAIPATGSYEVTWTATAQDQSWPAEHYGVYISTTSPVVSAFTMIQEWTLSTGVFHPVIDLSAYAGETIYIALRHFNCTDNFRLSIDDFIVREQAGANQVTVNLNPNNPAYGTVAGSGIYAIGDSVTISATAASGYAFARWVDADNVTISTDNPYTFVAATDLDLTAVFLDNTTTYTITVQVNDSTMGTATGGGTYTAGDFATLEATPNPGFRFVNWTQSSGFGINVISDEPTINVTVTSDKTFIANFEADSTQPQQPDSLVVSFATNDANLGTTNPAPGTYIYHAGDTVSFTAIPTTGNSFVAWIISYSDGTADTADARFPSGFLLVDTMLHYGITSVSVNAFFQAGVPTPDSISVTYTVNDATMGSINPNGTMMVAVGDTLSATATANAGYELYAWQFAISVAGQPMGDTTIYTTEASADFGIVRQFYADYGAAITITAMFRQHQGIDDVSADMNIFSTGNRIVVRGAEGEDIYIYDLNGRTVATKANAGETMEFTMESSGVYMVKVGNAPAKRVLVVR